jgi:hypothetical protein
MNTIRIIKLSMIRWVGDIGNICKTTERPKQRRQLGDLYVGGGKFGEIIYGSADWNQLTQDTVQWWTFVNMVMNLQISQKQEISRLAK